ncbi:hypothetical protein IWQ60_006612 [Tieghemiomyces parasiticus]|uniref:Expansin-like EG45 domain-containing protein n=1 Tax=Tieghemiomyces parasiticus TaxID=78921 RepID=A0A9W8A481_9FUNG|nr:hypothetical protein IWQ60_006612 [Tieghemiomyces parasiticus]
MSLSSLLRLALVCALISYGPALAALRGAQVITPQNYIDLGPVAANNPPTCGMAYASLDLTRITAVQNLDIGSDCGKCIKVINGADESKFAYVLVVDKGGRGLDVSTVTYQEVFGQSTDPAQASWSEVNASYCSGIWSDASAQGNSPGGDGDSADPVTSAIASPSPAAMVSAPAPAGTVPSDVAHSPAVADTSAPNPAVSNSEPTSAPYANPQNGSDAALTSTGTANAVTGKPTPSYLAPGNINSDDRAQGSNSSAGRCVVDLYTALSTTCISLLALLHVALLS